MSEKDSNPWPWPDGDVVEERGQTPMLKIPPPQEEKGLTPTPKVPPPDQKKE